MNSQLTNQNTQNYDNNSNNSNFLSGLQELVARLIAFILITTMFSVYAVGRNQPLSFDATNMALMLMLYWFCYELVSFVFYMILKRFSSFGINNVSKTENILDTKIQDKDNGEVNIET